MKLKKMVQNKMVEKVHIKARKQKPNTEDDERIARQLQDDTDTSCETCGLSNHPESMLLCDCCDRGYHLSCLNPPKTRIPRGDWFCDICQEFYIGHQPQSTAHNNRVFIEESDEVDEDGDSYIADDFVVEDDDVEYDSECSYEAKNVHSDPSEDEDMLNDDLSDSDAFVSPPAKPTRSRTTSTHNTRQLRRIRKVK